MILQRLVLKNFRQFRGLQEMVFAEPSQTEKDGNVTLIFGGNGTGKTGIFRGIMYGLYGLERLSQDADVTREEIHLVNIAELFENGQSSQRRVECFVELHFLHHGVQYIIKRTLYAIRDADSIVEEPGPVCLTVQSSDGNSKVVEDPSEILVIINRVLDSGIREYFLFDGEKIERLTRASTEQRLEIAKGIKNLLSIDTLETAIKALSSLRKTLDQKLQEKSTGQYQVIIRKCGEYFDKLEEITEKVSLIEAELELATEEKRKVDNEFEKIKEIEELLKRRSDLEAHDEDLKQELKSKLSKMKDVTGKTSFLLLSDTIAEVFDNILGALGN